jgi:SAM-dependent methyltransferase
MPSSYLGNVPVIVRTMARLDPARVLDVGPGYGRYGFLFRERVDDFRWERVLHGVDVFPDYMQRSGVSALYDRMYEGDFLEVEFDEQYDLVLLIDVLEHFTEDDGGRALEKALALAPTVLIATPIGYEQGEMYGNPYEEHRSEWPTERLDAFAGGHGARWERDAGGRTDCVIGLLRRG